MSNQDLKPLGCVGCSKGNVAGGANHFLYLYTSGVLRLNDEVLARGSAKKEHYSLLPEQTYLNVDEDAAGTLERKRNIIYCVIIQIMKSEKELHIDNLVFKVIILKGKECWKKSMGQAELVGRETE